MKRLAAVALAVGVGTASCTGHGTGSMIPSAGAAPGTLSPTTRGAHAASFSPSDAAPAGWAATGTHAIPLANAVDRGAVSPSQAITVHVGLQMQNMAALQKLVAGGGTIGNATFMSTYAPTAAR